MAFHYGGTSALTVQLAGPFGSIGSGSKITTVTLPAADWKNAASPFFQSVEIAGISESSMVMILPDREQVAKFCVDGTALHIENNSGVTTAYAIGTKPNEDLVLQVTLTEVVSA